MPLIRPIEEAYKEAQRNAIDADWCGSEKYSFWKAEEMRLKRLIDAGQQFEVLF